MARGSSAASNEAAGGDSHRLILVWVLALFGLTALGIAPLYVFGLDVQHLSPQTVSPLVGIGIELTAYAPSLAALLVATFAAGGGGGRHLLAQLGRWRAHLGWYAIALLGPIALFLVASVIRVALGGRPPSTWLVLPSGFALAFAIGSVVAGSLGEELGWRGFGQARLQRRDGAVAASLVVGVIWTAWHYWGVFAPGGLADFSLGGLGLSLVRMCALSVLYAWLYNASQQRLPVAMAAHAGHNIANNIVPSTAGGIGLGDTVIFLYAASAIVVVALTQRRLALDTRATTLRE